MYRAVTEIGEVRKHLFDTEPTVWQDIPGYEGKYQASNCGCIKSLKRFVKNSANGKTYSERIVPERILKAGRFAKSGHLSVVLEKGKPGKPVHHIIMETFVGETPQGMEIRHLNGDPTDNRLSNLAFGSRTDNILDVFRQGRAWRKVNVSDVLKIRWRLSCGEKGADIARSMGISPSIVSRIKTGKTFSWLDDEFMKKLEVHHV